ncbi:MULTISPECIES: 4Fe-4S dicluster domain-containing protein [unclassified Nitratiruptor]|uniref:4Fe-4S dicluster domain-containing protein n=1 Tax=unclassified Nitratiruptor TaxID=2624044 RepID=UPI001915CEF8|nr:MULTISPECIES: 4Fe-4S binding protein [unclassified Nitratiruptor]BCD59876.1 ferredoxin [Nitratiruptor sp. YY08-10]BCD63799.1 ferredoxin [Nitratiruptor sp. YY08-14]
MLKLNPSSCVRYYSKLSECNKCEAICPVEAVETKEAGIAIYQDKCVECGGCVGVCPTEALELSDFNVTNFFFEFLNQDEQVISCKTNFVCLAALGTEYMIALGIVKDIVLDIGHCPTCELKEKCFPAIEDMLNEANYVLQTIGGKEIKAESLVKTKETEPNRREFFNLFSLKKVAQAKSEFESKLEALDNPEIALDAAGAKAIKEKSIPNKRKLLFTLLKKMGKPDEYKILENRYLSFTSDKTVDETCDNCSICYRICPTEALSTTRKMDAILFDPLLCVRCHLCHDVCEKKSIQLAETFDTKEFFEPSQKILAKFNVVRCIDCGNFFTYTGGEQVCPRCKIEEEEAKTLWGIE